MASLFKSRYFSSCYQSLSTASLIVNFSGSFLCKSIRGNSLRLSNTENQFSCLGSNKENKLLLDALEMHWWQPECQIFSCRELTVKMAARPSVILSPLAFLKFLVRVKRYILSGTVLITSYSALFSDPTFTIFNEEWSWAFISTLHQ